MKYDIIIIGSGPAALTAAIYTSRSNLKTLVLASQKWGGQLMLTSEVENFPGFPKGVQGPELMQKMRSQAERFGAKIKDEEVTKVDFAAYMSYKSYTSYKTYISRAVIIAAGADTRWLSVPGERELIGRGVSSCASCDAFFYKNKKVIVVGGGDSAMEEALILTKFASSVTIVHRRDKFRASQIMQDRVLKHPKIKILWNSQVVDVLGKEKVEAVKIKTTLLEKEIKKLFPQSKKLKNSPKNPNSKLPVTSYQLLVTGLFVAIGHIPNTAIFKGVLNLDKKGFIKRFNHSATSVGGVFVAGDCFDYRYRQAVTAAGFGCQAALDAQRWLAENST